MRVCFYSPYIPKHTGGGEKHLFDVAGVVAQKHEVNVAISELASFNESKIRHRYENFLGYSIDRLTFIDTPLGSNLPSWQKLWWTKDFDYLYYVTDGSLFFSLAKKNNLHIQLPFTNAKNSQLERLKLANWQVKNANSEFTKKIVERAWKTKITLVHHPQVTTTSFSPQHPKEKIILSVGRFFKHLHSKRQDVLVNTFKGLVKECPDLMRGWRLVLVGTVEDQAYFEEVKTLAAGVAVEFKVGISRKELIELYNASSIYWHAAGYGVDELTHPEQVEHFGISTVEAMAAGAIPLVVGKGGQKEVLGPGLQHLTWQKIEECIKKTTEVFQSDSVTVNQLRQQVVERASVFDTTQFERQVWQMFGVE